MEKVKEEKDQDKIFNKLIITFKDGHQEKRNIYNPLATRPFLNKHSRKKEIVSAFYYNGEGSKHDVIKQIEKEVKKPEAKKEEKTQSDKKI